MPSFVRKRLAFANGAVNHICERTWQGNSEQNPKCRYIMDSRHWTGVVRRGAAQIFGELRGFLCAVVGLYLTEAH